MGLAIVLTAVAATAQERTKDKDKDKDKPAEAAPPTAAAPESETMSAQDQEVLGWANELAKEVTRTIEGWITSGSVTRERLFSYLYYPMPNTEPIKFTTDYDSLADRDFQGIIDKTLGKSNLLSYAVAMDKNGYVPTHNRQYSLPLTGNRAVDLAGNRTKRIFGDHVGIRAARNTKPYLLQTYSRDTGERLGDISVPINIRGQHWGCVRIGYRQVERQQ